jgi:alpha-glucoside transport system substrate-binding protein
MMGKRKYWVMTLWCPPSPSLRAWVQRTCPKGMHRRGGWGARLPFLNTHYSILNTLYPKRAWHTLLWVVMLFFMVGCVARPTPAPNAPSRFVTNPTPTPAPADNTLFVIGSFTGDQETQMLALLERFTAETGIQTLYRGNGEVAELLRQSVESGQTPDVILLPKANWLHELAGAGAITPLPADVAATVQTNFSDTWQNEVSHDGLLYGVPFDANLKSLLWYRPAPDVTAPESLATLTALATTRSEAGNATLTVTGGAGWMLTDWFENVLLATAGTELYDALVTHQIAWTDPQVVAAAEAYVNLLQPAHLLDGTGGATLPLDEVAFVRTFSPGAAESLFWIGQGSIVTRYADSASLTPETDYTIAPFPTNGALVVVGSLAVGTNERAETAQFLNYLAQPQSVEPWVQQGGFISPNLALPSADYPTSVARTEAELLINAPALRGDLSDQLPPNLNAYLGEQLREMLLRPTDIEMILADIEAIATREQGRTP